VAPRRPAPFGPLSSGLPGAGQPLCSPRSVRRQAPYHARRTPRGDAHTHPLFHESENQHAETPRRRLEESGPARPQEVIEVRTSPAISGARITTNGADTYPANHAVFHDAPSPLAAIAAEPRHQDPGPVDHPAESIRHAQEEQTDPRDQNGRADGQLEHADEIGERLGGPGSVDRTPDRSASKRRPKCN